MTTRRENRARIESVVLDRITGPASAEEVATLVIEAAAAGPNRRHRRRPPGPPGPPQSLSLKTDP
ncbi:hypothetical protein [Streptomyces sp. H23]|uniref:hypothetical protein n=1 Tax=unclassified Streptomyces TaxID=2593676 RepID=UPI00106E1074|nr:hypothetical protein [Streptomyces sp. H23]